MFTIFRKKTATVDTQTADALTQIAGRVAVPPIPTTDTTGQFTDCENLLFAVGVESEASFLPQRIKALKPYDDEAADKFARRKEKLELQLALLLDLGNQPADRVLARFLDIVERDVCSDEPDEFLARNLRNDATLCQANVIQSVFRQCVTSVLFAEHVQEQRQARQLELGRHTFGAEDIGREPLADEGADTAEPGQRAVNKPETLRDTLKLVPVSEQQDALGILFPKLAGYKMALESTIEGWDMFMPRDLEFFSARQDEHSEYQSAYTYEDARQMYGWSRAQRAQRSAETAVARKRAMRAMLA
jgi:hypothetical protein